MSSEFVFYVLGDPLPVKTGEYLTELGASGLPRGFVNPPVRVREISGNSEIALGTLATAVPYGELAGSSQLDISGDGSSLGAIMPITGDADLAITTTGALAAIDTLAGSAEMAITTSGLLSGLGAMSASSDLAITTTGQMASTGQMGAAAQISITTFGALTGGALLKRDGWFTKLGTIARPRSTLDVEPSNIVGDAELTITTVATLTAEGALAGDVSMAIDTLSDLTGLGLMDGSVDLAITTSGVLGLPEVMAGNSTLAITTGGNLTSGGMIAAADLAITTGGTLTAFGSLIGNSTLAITTTGTTSGTEIGESDQTWTAVERSVVWTWSASPAEWIDHKRRAPA